MIELYNGGVYLVNGKVIIPEGPEAAKAVENATGRPVSKEEASKETISYGILTSHNTSGDSAKLRIKFDKLVSHDITFVGIIQTARASGLKKFPIPYCLTNCHNSLCAVGGTINEDDHMFGLSCARKYGGIYVPPHQAVIHQYAREMMSGAGKMILGSDSHTRYGALGTMAVGEGGPELVKQLLEQTYDIDYPGVVAVYLENAPKPGVGPQDVALSIVGAVFGNGYVKNKVMEFVGPGVSNLSADFRIGVDVMTTETTCLSSIWRTDGAVKEYYELHGRPEEYEELNPGETAYYDGMIRIDLSKIEPTIAMPFHPSNTYTIREFKANMMDIIEDVEKKAAKTLEGNVEFSLKNKVKDGQFHVDQAVIAGCAGGGFENICQAADILRGRNTGNGEFSLNVYPASTPIYMELMKNGVAAELMAAGAIIKTAFCGPCFGAGDTPAHNAFSIRHSTRNFPNREGSKIQNGQISSVALMDARSIAATAANGGVLTAADEMDVAYTDRQYFFNGDIYKNRIFDSQGKADESAKIHFGPGIKDWPVMPKLGDNLIIKVVSEIHDAVTTTDELIPSGETSSYRSNPHALSEFALSRKDPEYVGRAKAVRLAEKVREDKLTGLADSEKEIYFGKEMKIPASMEEALPELTAVLGTIRKSFPEVKEENTCIGSTIFAAKPGDGSAREQAASCQRVLGGFANIAFEYATKRYRSNLINWGMLPFIIEKGELPFSNLDYIFIPDIKNAVETKKDTITAYRVGDDGLKAFELTLGALTDEERQIILKGCLINYNGVS